jgi:hypothetical protein
VHDAKIDINGKDGAYTVKVDGGKIMTCTTEPVLGGDNKTPITHTNTKDALNPTMYQGPSPPARTRMRHEHHPGQGPQLVLQPAHEEQRQSLNRSIRESGRAAVGSPAFSLGRSIGMSF